MTKSKKFRALLSSENLEFLMEAHNGITAKIVERSGFKGIWASGLTISASLGVRDNNELSFTQLLNILEFMNDSTKLPILVDGDTGYGNFNNLRRLIKYLERIGIAGVCVEDKTFPKNNSFLENTAQQLVSIPEFCGKIRAAKDAQKDPYFSLIARTEAFIAGKSLDEALGRAYAYAEAGADAIVVHSRKTDSSEVDSFMRNWKNDTPIIIIPTKYYQIPTDHFRERGIKMIIWANQLMRGLIPCLEKVAKKIYEDESVSLIESDIAPISKLFDYQNVDELKEAEKKYMLSVSPLEKAQSFGIVPLKKENKQWKVFIIKHKSGHWGFPKGHPKDSDEKPEETAERELYEETGLKIKSYLPIEPLSTSYRCFSHGKEVDKTVNFFVALVSGEVSLCHVEIEDGQWISVEDVNKKILFSQMRQCVKELISKLLDCPFYD